MVNYKDLNDYEIMYMVEENDDYAKSLVYEKYKPIVMSTAIKYQSKAKKCGLELDDLVQEGYVGIYNAISHYRSDMNVKFYTYVIISIKSKILNCLKKEDTFKSKILNNSVSLDEPISCMEDTLLLDIVEDKSSILPELEIERNEIFYLIENFMHSLEFNESLVFELKLNGFCCREIANLLNISSSTASKLWIDSRKKFISSLSLT